MRPDLDRLPLSPRPSALDPTRARPEPWFVGNGTGLMIGVLLVCAVLMVVRVASLFWMADRVRQWWQAGPEASSLARAPLSSPKLVPQRPRPVPPADLAQVNAPLRGNPGEAFGPDAYPLESIRHAEQGRVVARLRIDARGTPRRCAIVESSGFPRLDKATCEVALARVNYQPARDGAGVPIPATATLPVRWVLPEE